MKLFFSVEFIDETKNSKDINKLDKKGMRYSSKTD